MAITFSHSIPLLYVLALVSTLASLFINLAMADKALIDSICQRALNPGLCHNVLDSSTGADRATLGKIAVQASLQKAKSTSGLIRSLASSGNDKEAYQTCLDVYDDAIDNLNECDALLASQKFEDANMKASAASTDEDTCADEAQHAPADLKVANKEFADYTSIVLSVTNV